MDSKKQLGKNIAALLLFAALMLPTAIQFFHMFEGHEHIACNENSTHMHETVVKCDIYHFHSTSFNYDILKYPDFSLPTIPTKTEVSFASLQFHSFVITNTQLRAPPFYS
ncbi:hypothetical protein [Aequorivita marina]|uniref:hypothetical protein n=1 Tax=Aequorivita marina TaxID=3073654 RepID=UPI0028741B55|nr:hypothetical protein [Aequorivita sp. S2608]MDS1298005.1 hypothetical protein [Aequorivita sp. S2608]